MMSALRRRLQILTVVEQVLYVFVFPGPRGTGSKIWGWVGEGAIGLKVVSSPLFHLPAPPLPPNSTVYGICN